MIFNLLDIKQAFLNPYFIEVPLFLIDIIFLKIRHFSKTQSNQASDEEEQEPELLIFKYAQHLINKLK